MDALSISLVPVQMNQPINYSFGPLLNHLISIRQEIIGRFFVVNQSIIFFFLGFAPCFTPTFASTSKDRSQNPWFVRRSNDAEELELLVYTALRKFHASHSSPKYPDPQGMPRYAKVCQLKNTLKRLNLKAYPQRCFWVDDDFPFGIKMKKHVIVPYRVVAKYRCKSFFRS